MKIYNIHSYKDFLCHVENKPNNLLILFVYKDDYIIECSAALDNEWYYESM